MLQSYIILVSKNKFEAAASFGIFTVDQHVLDFDDNLACKALGTWLNFSTR